MWNHLSNLLTGIVIGVVGTTALVSKVIDHIIGHSR